MAAATCYDAAVVGGGIVGMATAMALAARPRLSVIVLEAEERLAVHQSGHNSGVVHSGLYYAPGSLKARTCVEGREALYRFCAEHGIPYERCGKIVVAATPAEVPGLEELERRGHGNGLAGLRRLGPAEIREHEPHVAGVAGLFVPETGIVDFARVVAAYADVVRAAGGVVRTGSRLLGLRRERDGLSLETCGGAVCCRHLVNCAGLQADRVARLCGIDPGVQIIPFRGEYHVLAAQRRHLVRNLVYPVPDPAFPFLGVHLTRTVHGTVEAGPNAVLALKREGYRRSSFSAADVLAMACYRGFWRMARRHWRSGLRELDRSLRRRAFVAALRRLVPDLDVRDLQPAGAGVRAQAVDPAGLLVDDFRIVAAERMTHVLNAPSPAATASIAIGRAIAGMAARGLGVP